MRQRQCVAMFAGLMVFGLPGFGVRVHALNLVPNPDFESFIVCPFGAGGLSGVVSDWTTPTNGTSDYFHPCETAGGALSTPANFHGSQAPLSGVAYAGFIGYIPNGEYREYMEVPLTAALTLGQTYAISFFVSLSDNSPYAIAEIGAYVQAGSMGPNPTTTALLVTPQVENVGGVISDKTTWTAISGTMVAMGGESHLVIGNFRDDANTTLADVGPAIGHFAYYYVDDVSVTAVDPGCNPTPDGLACTQGCTLATEQCAPREILTDSTGNFLEVTCCDCGQGCHIDYEPATQTMFCSGGCAANGNCIMVGKGNLDGTITYSCECFTQAEPCQFEAVCNLDCGPGTCVRRCNGPCPIQTEECLPDTIIELPPVPGGETQATCDCTEAGLEPCRPVKINGEMQCIGLCPQGLGPCHLLTTTNADGTVEYDCDCSIPPEPCEPVPPAGTECGGECAVAGEICVPQQITADINGNFLTIDCCDCKPDPFGIGPECHVDFDPMVGVFCANPCDDPDLECTLMGKGNADGTITYECECIDISTPHECEYVTECSPCVGGPCQKHCTGLCPPPFDACVPKEITDDGTGLGNFTVTDCDCGELGPDECRPVINPMTLIVECVGSCPNQTPCPLQEVVNADGSISYSCPPCQGGEEGACCIQAGPGTGTVCVPMSMMDCNLAQGMWLGFVSCDPDPCPQPVYPCCILDPCEGSTCQMLTEVECEEAGGSTHFWVFPPSCTPDPCIEGIGACCTTDAGASMCQLTTALECNAQFGIYQGDETTCSPDPCVDIPEKQCGVAQCCQRPPRFNDPNYAGFTGPVAIETSRSFVGFSLFPERITIFDISNRASAPLNIAWPGVPRYSHPSWNGANLGTIFGITLDKQGNMYVTDTTSYTGDEVGPGGWGSIYKIDNTTAVSSTFATLPNTGPGLGNIDFDCRHNQFYVTNMEDGKIYRLSLAGVTLSTFDHGTPDDGAPGFAPLGQRLWGVAVFNNRVYYAVWNRNGFTSGTGFNQIWSVSLGCGVGGADFCAGSAQWEIDIPLFTLWSYTYSHPVSDISFTTNGCMLLSERSMFSDSSLGSHDARVLEYCQSGIIWVPTGHVFDIGDPISLVGGNSAGGNDYDIDGNIWASGDALKFSTQTIYGLQSLPPTGGSPANSVLLDRDGNWAAAEKTQQGDVEVPCLGCVKPPMTLAAWWPLDEPAPPIANDLTLVNDGVHTNGPIVTPGKVSRALLFDGVDDRVTVPDNNTLDFPNGCLFFFNCPIPRDFSIDAWVRTCEDTGVRTIVDKLNTTSFFFSWTNGYSFYLNNGVLELQLGDQTLFGGGVSSFADSSATVVADGAWHHVAVTIDRDQPTGGVFYVDGVAVSTFNPTARNKSISNSYPLWIGARQSSPGQFSGDIDEVQIFRRSVPASEMQAIHAAQNAGKCKDRCAVPPKLTYAPFAGTLNASMTLCNDSTVPHNYTWTMTGLPAGGACTITGPTVFAPSSGIVNIPAGTCLNILVTITAPPGLVSPQTACYEFSATNIETGGMTTCNGQLGRNKWIIVWGGGLNPTKLSVGRRTQLTFDVTNDSEPSETLDYLIRAVAHDDSGGAAQSGISLNGLPPGTPVTGSLTLPLGQSTTVTVNGAFLEHWPLGHHELQFEDLNPSANSGALMQPEMVGSHVVQSEYLQPGAPLAAPAPHDRAKNRYISFVPAGVGIPMIYRISEVSSDEGPIGWVGVPNAQGIAPVLATMPTPRVWTEAVVHVGDCEIHAVAVYEVDATEDGVVFSDPIAIPTAPQPQGKFWGDTVGSFTGGAWDAPNGVANANDFVAALQGFQSLASAPHVSVTDVQAGSSSDPCLNRVTNFADVFLLIKAFQGDPYPFTTNPGSCPSCP